MKKGDRVVVHNQGKASYYDREGVIVAVVKSGQYPFGVKLPAGCKLKAGCTSIRDHRSYLVQVRKLSTLMWPRVKNIELAK